MLPSPVEPTVPALFKLTSGDRKVPSDPPAIDAAGTVGHLQRLEAFYSACSARNGTAIEYFGERADARPSRQC